MNGNNFLMFNKKYNLVYGKFLREFSNIDEFETLYFKQPSFIHKEEYQKILYELLAN